MLRLLKVPVCASWPAMESPLIRRDSKSGVGVAPNAVFSAWLVARRRNAAQIDNVIAFNMVRSQSEQTWIQRGTIISSLLRLLPV
jgi:hypothetical protein